MILCVCVIAKWKRADNNFFSSSNFYRILMPYSVCSLCCIHRHIVLHMLFSSQPIRVQEPRAVIVVVILYVVLCPNRFSVILILATFNLLFYRYLLAVSLFVCVHATMHIENNGHQNPNDWTENCLPSHS